VEGGPGQGKAVSAGELLRNKGALIGCALFSFQQFSGINAIVYFSSSVFAQARRRRLRAPWPGLGSPLLQTSHHPTMQPALLCSSQGTCASLRQSLSCYIHE
jgi:hypothetical protein